MHSRSAIQSQIDLFNSEILLFWGLIAFTEIHCRNGQKNGNRTVPLNNVFKSHLLKVLTEGKGYEVELCFKNLAYCHFTSFLYTLFIKPHEFLHCTLIIH